MKYFTLKELTASDTVRLAHVKNEPTACETAKLIALIDEVLDPCREAFGNPIIVTSGYRSKTVNTLVKGAKNSQHTKGEAADIKACKGGSNAEIFEIIKRQNNFDQLIWEKGTDKEPAWVHVSYKSPEENRHEVLKAVVAGGKTVYKRFRLV